MKRYVVDTNIILRFLLRDIENQYKTALGVFKKAESKKIKLFTPQIVIFELEFALRKFYKFEKGNVVELMESIVTTNYLGVETKDEFIDSLRIYRSKNVSFVDCFIKEYSKTKKARLLSFDKKI